MSRSMTTRGAVKALMLVALGGAVGAGGTYAIRAGVHPMDRITTHGEWVKFANAKGDSIRAYVAYPERKDAAPAVIVIHEIFGLTDWEPTVVDKLAGAGYVAIVPDLQSSHYGASPADPDSGRKITALLVPDDVTADLDATFGYITSLPSVKKNAVATIGFCWGGGQSFRYATNNPKLKAAVVCYGPPPDSAGLSRIHIPILGIYGENDNRIASTLGDVTARLKAQGVPFPHDSYPGTGHGFLKPGRKGSDTDQVGKAWDAIFGFYHQYLDK